MKNLRKNIKDQDEFIRSRRKLIFILLGLGLSFLILIFIKNKPVVFIDPKAYIEIKEEGLDGRGMIRGEFLEDKFKKDLAKALKAKDIDKLVESFKASLSLSKTSNLSNKDKVLVSLGEDFKEKGIELKNKSFIYEVSGLKKDNLENNNQIKEERTNKESLKPIRQKPQGLERDDREIIGEFFDKNLDLVDRILIEKLVLEAKTYYIYKLIAREPSFDNFTYYYGLSLEEGRVKPLDNFFTHRLSGLDITYEGFIHLSDIDRILGLGGRLKEELNPTNDLDGVYEIDGLRMVLEDGKISLDRENILYSGTYFEDGDLVHLSIDGINNNEDIIVYQSKEGLVIYEGDLE
ncbi:MAG: hypothetical protein Q4D88_03840 [Anaerococcus sp.]|nr:hypothetical protein [Anaerococcus sp.]